jgi:4-hydroxy-tetrahydrodipicolinate synthase
MSAYLLSGSGVALVTPFTHALEIDWPAFGRVLAHTGQGSDFAVVGGTTGESATLRHGEKAALVRATQQHTAWVGKPIVLGLGGNDTQALLAGIAETDFDGITAILSVTPYYNKPTTRGLVAHYTALANACPVPVLLYNVPSRTGTNLGPVAVEELAHHPNIIGLKEASADMMQWQHQRRVVPSDFILLAGDDGLALPMLAAGAAGVIGVLGNILPLQFGDMIRAALRGDMDVAWALHKEYLCFQDALYPEGNPVGVKAALEAAGICAAVVRPPLAEASAPYKAAVGRQLLEVLGQHHSGF